MNDLNYLIIEARVSKAPELKTSDKGVTFCKFSVANNERYKDTKKAHFFECIAYDKTAEFINRQFSVGRKILLSGKLQQNKWLDSDGTTRYNIYILVKIVKFMDEVKNVDKNYINQNDSDSEFGGSD